MDNVESRPSKRSSKLSGFLPWFVKKLAHSNAVKGDYSSRTCNTQVEDYCIMETECSDEAYTSKIHPQPFEENLNGDGVDLIDFVVHKLFDSISSLKTSYIQFQKGHIPYDSEKIRCADDRMVSQLESLSDMEHFYVERQKSKSKTLVSLNAEIQEQQDLLDKLQSEAQSKETEILRLRWEIEELESKNAELEDEIKRTFLPEEEVLLSNHHLTSNLFSVVFEATAKAIHEFGKPLISLMKASGWNLKQAADTIEPSVIYMERSHKKYAFEAYLSRKMFSRNAAAPNDKLKKEGIDDVLKFQDAFAALIAYPDSNFAHFCLTNYPRVVHPEMEYIFFGNLDQREFVVNQKHPRTPFYIAFVKMARWIWILQLMVALMHPRAEMFYVKNGCNFREDHMESVVKIEGYENLQVAFTVMPGFRIGNSVVKCKVYLSGMVRQEPIGPD